MPNVKLRVSTKLVSINDNFIGFNVWQIGHYPILVGMYRDIHNIQD